MTVAASPEQLRALQTKTARQHWVRTAAAEQTTKKKKPVRHRVLCRAKTALCVNQYVEDTGPYAGEVLIDGASADTWSTGVVLYEMVCYPV